MKLFFKSVFLLAGILLFSTAATAQMQQMQQPQPLDPDSISQDQLETFSVISTELQVIQQEARSEFQTIVEDAGMEFSRFQQIAMMSQNPQMADSINMSDEEKAMMQQIQPKLMQKNQQMQQQMLGIIQEEGMNPQTFQQIAMTIQQSPELQQRLQALDEQDGSDY